MSTSTAGSPYEPHDKNQQNNGQEGQRQLPQQTKRRRHLLFVLAGAIILSLGIGAAAVAMSENDDNGPGPRPGSTYLPDPDPTPRPQREPSWERRPEPVPEPEPEPTYVGPEPQIPAPPQELVGRWNGGPGDSSDWNLTIGSDGQWTLLNDVLGFSDAGTVDASNHAFEMSNETGNPEVVEGAGIYPDCEWEISDAAGFTTLYFCGDLLTNTSSWVPAN